MINLFDIVSLAGLLQDLMERSLYEAVCSDNVKEARKLLQSGADANSFSEDHVCMCVL